jgi:hypothetical protein
MVANGGPMMIGSKIPLDRGTLPGDRNARGYMR